MGETLPKEECIVGSMIQKVNDNYIIYYHDDKSKTYQFDDDIKEYCYNIFSKIKDKFIFRRIICYNDTILLIDDIVNDRTIEYISNCLEMKNGEYIIKK